MTADVGEQSHGRALDIPNLSREIGSTVGTIVAERGGLSVQDD